MASELLPLPHKSEPSSGAETAEASITVAAAGNYDPDAQLNSQQIAAMKQLFATTPGHERIQSLVVQEIVGGMLIDAALKDHESGNWELDEEEAKLLRNERVAALIKQAAFLGSHWQQGFEITADLEAGEWPDYLTPPATFAEPLKQERIINFIKGLRQSNPDIDFTEQTQLFKEVTGMDLDQEPGTQNG